MTFLIIGVVLAGAIITLLASLPKTKTVEDSVKTEETKPPVETSTPVAADQVKEPKTLELETKDEKPIKKRKPGRPKMSAKPKNNTTN